MVLTGQAHGKLLLFGEHAVVHGFPATGLTLPLSTRIHLSCDPDLRPDTENQAGVVEPLIPYMGPEVLGLWHKHDWHVRVESDVPMGCGLGSSAALTGALARAWALGLPHLAAQDTWRMAHQAERYFHGKPSGVDTTLALGQGLVTCQRVTTSMLKTEPCDIGPFALVVGVLPRTRTTRDLVQQVNHQLKTKPDATQAILAELGDLAVLPSVTERVWTVLGDRANRAQILLQRLGLSTPPLDQTLDTGLAAGACGGKLSGAGGGGAFVLFCQNTDSAKEVARALGTQPASENSVDPLHVSIYHWDGHALRASASPTSRSAEDAEV